jgi:hypothetical protein
VETIEEKLRAVGCRVAKHDGRLYYFEPSFSTTEKQIKELKNLGEFVIMEEGLAFMASDIETLVELFERAGAKVEFYATKEGSSVIEVVFAQSVTEDMLLELQDKHDYFPVGKFLKPINRFMDNCRYIVEKDLVPAAIQILEDGGVKPSGL